MNALPMHLSCLLLVACGGKGTVDLGNHGDTTGWADTKGSVGASATASTSKSKPSPVPETLYNGGESVLGIAVEGDTFVALMGEVPDDSECRMRVDACDLRDCKGTLRTIRSYEQCSPGPYPDPDAQAPILSHGEILWSEPYNGSNLSSQIVACSIAGCPAGPRQIAARDAAMHFTADAQYVYWTRRIDEGAGFVRCGRFGCITPEYSPISPNTPQRFDDLGNSTRLLVDESKGMIYALSGSSIARIPTDFSTELTPFYKDVMQLGDMAIVGDYVYFSVSSLLGQIRRCPTSGCEQGSELVLDAPRWPSSLVADEKAIYWQHKAKFLHTWSDSGGIRDDLDAAALSVSLLDGSKPAQLLVPSFQTYAMGGFLYRSLGPVMNGHHVYWCEVAGMRDSLYTNSIRMIAR